MSANRLLEGHKIKTGYDKKVIIDEVSLTLPPEKISIIIGANACGKSTLLKTMARLIKPYEGRVTLGGESVSSMGTKNLARQLGLMPQSPVVPEGITVSDLVARGRYPHQKAFGGLSQRDKVAIKEAMSLMGIEAIGDSCVDALSGGQRQRVWIAMALAQETDILILDEPTTFLDIAYQIEILDLLKDLNKKKGTTILMVLHDINLSARYGDYLFAMKAGALIAEGTPEEILNETLMKEVFDLTCHVMTDPISRTPMVLPISRHHR